MKDKGQYESGRETLSLDDRAGLLLSHKIQMDLSTVSGADVHNFAGIKAFVYSIAKQAESRAEGKTVVTEEWLDQLAYCERLCMAFAVGGVSATKKVKNKEWP
jgi:hypothetical protein